jgi:hypothetical protein
MKIPLNPPEKSLFLSLPLPRRERIEVRGTVPRTFLHPHPDPLPSREREIEALIPIRKAGKDFESRGHLIAK